MIRILDSLTETVCPTVYPSIEAAMASPEWAECAHPTILTGSHDPAQKPQSSACEDWNLIWRGAVLAADTAIQSRDWVILRQMQEIQSRAASGRDAVISSVFGGEAPDLSNRVLSALHQAGKTATPEQVKAGLTAISRNADELAAKKRAARPAIKSTQAKDLIQQGGKVLEGVVFWGMGPEVKADGGMRPYSLPRDARDFIGKRVRFVAPAKGRDAQILEVLGD